MKLGPRLLLTAWIFQPPPPVVHGPIRFLRFKLVVIALVVLVALFGRV